MYINMHGDVITQIMEREAMNTFEHWNKQKVVSYGLEFQWSN